MQHAGADQACGPGNDDVDHQDSIPLALQTRRSHLTPRGRETFPSVRRSGVYGARLAAVEFAGYDGVPCVRWERKLPAWLI
jgi:hypothetical protein